MENLTTIIATILGSGALTTLIVALFNKSKTRAETQNINVTWEVSIWTLAKDIANDLRVEVRALRLDMNKIELDLRGAISDNRSISDRLASVEKDNVKLVKRVKILEDENKTLRSENKTLKLQLSI